MNKRQAFSLVELSIVLVILGLLVGGILSGQSLIRAAELRSVTTEYQRYFTATQAFRDKYFALPGDMANATAFWGAAAGTGSDAACAAFASTNAATCNGNGDGRIFGGAAGLQENFRAWQHLANAGLIEGSYTGTQNVAPPNGTLGVNLPRARISNAGWSISHSDGSAFNTQAGDASYWGSQTNGNNLFFGALAADLSRASTVLMPEEAWNLDTKMDDGLPGAGKVFTELSLTPTASTCISSNTGSGSYNLTYSGKVCSFRFLLK